jgi:hypothetical protein
MKGVAFDVQSGHFGVAHFNALGVGFVRHRPSDEPWAAPDQARSCKPRSIVLRAIPVARDTALTPPHPAPRAARRRCRKQPPFALT